jgi:hypothetical protein
LETSTPPKKASLPRRIAIGLAVAIGLYGIVSYVAVPILVEDLVLSTVLDRTNRTAALEGVHFDPLRARLTVEGFSIPDTAADSPILSIDRLEIDVRPVGFVSAELAFDEVRLVRPLVSFVVGKDGELNVERLISELAGSDEEEEEETESAEDEFEMWVVEIGAIEIVEGRTTFRDERAEEPFFLTVAPIGLRLHDFTTRVGGAFRHELSVGIGDRTKLEWAGSITASPFEATGEIELTDLDLRTPWKYLSSRLQFEVSDGRASASASYAFSGESDWTLRIEEAALGLRDVAILDARQPTNRNAVVEIPNVDARGIEAVVEPGGLASLDIAGFESSGGRVRVIIEEDGGLAIVEVFQPRTVGGVEGVGADASDPAGESGGDGPATRVRVGEFVLGDFALDFADRSVAEPVALELGELKLAVSGFDTDPGARFDVDVESKVGASGTLRIAGPVEIEPLRSTLSIAASEIALDVFAPYLASAVRVEVPSGRLATKFDLELTAGRGSAVDVGATGRIQIDDVRVVGRSGNEELVRWKSVRLEGFELQPRTLEVSEVGIDGLFAHVAVLKDGSTNLDAVRVSEAAASTQPTPSPGEGDSPSEPNGGERAIEIEVVRIDASGLSVIDESVDPKFHIKFSELGGTIRDLSSTSKKPARVDLTGKVDDASPLALKGEIDPFGGTGTNQLSASLSAVSLPNFGPYSQRYVGYGIDRGNLDVELDYRLEGRHLVAKNRFLLAGFEFGARAPGSSQANLPFPLAMTLMRDSSGKIEIDLPVEGNLDDPSFNLLGLLGKAFLNLISKVATAPFAAISGVMDFSMDDLSQVVFAAGSNALSDAESLEIEKVVEVLSAKPRLQIGIRGRADPLADGLGEDAAAARALARERAAAIREAVEAGDRVLAGRIFMIDVQIGSFATPQGVPAELTLSVE